MEKDGYIREGATSQDENELEGENITVAHFEVDEGLFPYFRDTNNNGLYDPGEQKVLSSMPQFGYVALFTMDVEFNDAAEKVAETENEEDGFLTTIRKNQLSVSRWDGTFYFINPSELKDVRGQDQEDATEARNAETEEEREAIDQALKNYWDERAHPSPTSRP